MSLLNKLWDDTIAGPPPEKGLGKLRKQTNLSFRSLNSEKGTKFNLNTYNSFNHIYMLIGTIGLLVQ